MGNLFNSCHISSSFLLEANVVIMALGCVFMVDLFHHYTLKQKTLHHINTSLHMCLSTRHFTIRALSILGHLSSGILGIVIAKTPTIFKFASYILLTALTLIYTVAIGMSVYVYRKDDKYYSNIILHDLWMKDHIDPLEALFDCCGKHGTIDYLIDNRTWSKASCCDLPNCGGCEQMFHDFLRAFDGEIVRDNIILFLFLFISMLLTIVHFNNLVLDADPYLSEDEDEIEQNLESATSNTP